MTGFRLMTKGFQLAPDSSMKSYSISNGGTRDKDNGDLLVFRMSTRMNDTVHIQIQIIEFDSIWIWLRRINMH